MSAFDIAVIVIISVLVLTVIGIRLYRRFVKKERGCDCSDCNCCSACDCCKQKEQQQKQP